MKSFLQYIRENEKPPTKRSIRDNIYPISAGSFKTKKFSDMSFRELKQKQKDRKAEQEKAKSDDTKEKLDEVTRTRPRAQKLLNYIAKRSGSYTVPYSDTKNTKTDTQVQTKNIMPYVSYFKMPTLIDPDTNYPTEKYTIALEKGIIKKVPTNKTVSSQDTIQAEVSKLKIQGKWKGHRPEIPLMVKVDQPDHPLHGMHIVADGHHRVVAAKLLGRKFIKAKVAKVKLDPDYIKPEPYKAE